MISEIISKEGVERENRQYQISCSVSLPTYPSFHVFDIGMDDILCLNIYLWKKFKVHLHTFNSFLCNLFHIISTSTTQYTCISWVFFSFKLHIKQRSFPTMFSRPFSPQNFFSYPKINKDFPSFFQYKYTIDLNQRDLNFGMPI